MTELTWGVAFVIVGTYLWKLAGLSVPQTVLEHRVTLAIAALIPVAFLSALVAVQTFADGARLVLDARLVGVGVAAILLSLRVPFLPMLIAAAASTALVRMFF
jgi:uncharacterized membrane protein